MDGGTAHIPCAVADLHAPALEAVAERICHGVAQFAQLIFQLPLDLLALCFPHFIVFTIVHSSFHPSAGRYRPMIARATRKPSTAALMMPPA